MFKLKHLKHISIITLILFALAAIAVAGPGFSGRSPSFSSPRSFSSGGSSWSKPSSSSWSRPSTSSSSSWSKPSAPSSSSWSFPSSKPSTSARSSYFNDVAKYTPKVTIPTTKTYDTGYKPVKEVPTLPGKSYTTPSSTRTVEKHYYNHGSDNTLNTIVAASVLSNAMHNNRPQTVVVNNGTPVSAKAVPSATQNLRVEEVKGEGGMGFFGWLVSLSIIVGCCYALYKFAFKSHHSR